MLTKLTTTEQTVRLVLTCDESTLEAQVKAARYLVDEELTDREGKGDLVEGIVSAARSVAGRHSEFVALLLELKTVGSAMLGKVLTGDERDSAVNRLNDILEDEDVRQSLAYIRAQASLSQYRESSDLLDLLDPDPRDATWVEVRSISRDELRGIERQAGPRPRLGALHHSHAADRARRAGRRGDDGVEAFTEYLAEIGPEKQRAVEDFEDWQTRIDRAVFRASVQKVDGFDLTPGPKGYPVEEFIQLCPEAGDVITEVSRAALQVGRLGKRGGLSACSAPGMDESDNEAPVTSTGGSVANA